MDLADQMNDDVDAVFLNTAEHAETIIYQPANETPRTIKAIILREEGALVVGAVDGRNQVRRANIMISSSDDDGVANINELDTILFDGIQWRTEGRPNNDGYGMQSVNVSSITRPEISRQDLRINRS